MAWDRCFAQWHDGGNQKKLQLQTQSLTTAPVKAANGSGGIWTHAPKETGALIQHLGPLGHTTTWGRQQCFSQPGLLLPYVNNPLILKCSRQHTSSWKMFPYRSYPPQLFAECFPSPQCPESNNRSSAERGWTVSLLLRPEAVSSHRMTCEW